MLMSFDWSSIGTVAGDKKKDKMQEVLQISNDGGQGGKGDNWVLIPV